MSNNEMLKTEVAQWKKNQQLLLDILKEDPVRAELEKLFNFWKNPSGNKMPEKEFTKFKNRITTRSPKLKLPKNRPVLMAFFDLFKSYCVFCGDKGENIDSNFIAAMANEFGEGPRQQNTTTIVNPTHQNTRIIANHLNQNTTIVNPLYQNTTTIVNPLHQNTTTIASSRPPITPPPPPPSKGLDIVSIFFAPALCAISSGTVFLLHTFTKLNILYIGLIAAAFITVTMLGARLISAKLNFEQNNVYFGRALSLSIAYQIFACWLFNFCGTVWYYSLPVILGPFLVTAKSFIFIRKDYPKSKFVLFVLGLALVPFLATGGFFAYKTLEKQNLLPSILGPVQTATAPVASKPPVQTATPVVPKNSALSSDSASSTAETKNVKSAESSQPAQSMNTRYREALSASNAETEFKLLKPLADSGYAKAQETLGFRYQYGRGCKKDLDLAEYYFKKAAAQKLSTVFVPLGYLYLQQGKYQEALDSFLEAKKNGTNVDYQIAECRKHLRQSHTQEKVGEPLYAPVLPLVQAPTRQELKKRFDEILRKLPPKVAFQLVAEPDQFSVNGSALYMTVEESQDIVDSAINLTGSVIRLVGTIATGGRHAPPSRRPQTRIEYHIRDVAFTPDIKPYFYQAESGYFENYIFNEYRDRRGATKLPLISPSRDQFYSVKSRLSDNKSSVQALETLLNRMERGEIPICRYVVRGKFQSYSERHEKIAQRQNMIDFAVHCGIAIDLEIIDRLTGKKLSCQWPISVRYNGFQATFASNLRSTEGLKFNRAKVFKTAAKRFMNKLMKELSEGMPL